jgi:hypothetical protein
MIKFKGKERTRYNGFHPDISKSCTLRVCIEKTGTIINNPKILKKYIKVKLIRVKNAKKRAIQVDARTNSKYSLRETLPEKSV